MPCRNSFVTAQALFDDTCAAIFVSTTFVGTCVLDGAENNATAVGRYASDFQNEVLLSDLSMPMTMSTVPSLRADSASDPTLTTSSFSPKLSASAAATSTSMPTILDEEEGCPARGWLSVFTPTRSVPSLPMVGEDSVGVFSGGV